MCSGKSQRRGVGEKPILREMAQNLITHLQCLQVMGHMGAHGVCSSGRGTH